MCDKDPHHLCTKHKALVVSKVILAPLVVLGFFATIYLSADYLVKFIREIGLTQ